MTKHESKTDYLHKISNDFMCIFSNISIFSEIEVKRKKQFIKSFALIGTIEYQNVIYISQFSHQV